MNNQRGYFGIGCERMKTKFNYGSLFRTAQILGADFIFVIGARFERQSTDTMKSWRHIPAYSYDTFEQFNAARPFDCPLVGIELTEDATCISDFKHPERACYLLGAEDHGLSSQAMQACQRMVRIPGEMSLNVSVAGSIIIYDRIQKQLLKNKNFPVY